MYSIVVLDKYFLFYDIKKPFLTFQLDDTAPWRDLQNEESATCRFIAGLTGAAVVSDTERISLGHTLKMFQARRVFFCLLLFSSYTKKSLQ